MCAEPVHPIPPHLTRSEASDWTLRLALELHPLPISNEALWAILERYYAEALWTEPRLEVEE